LPETLNQEWLIARANFGQRIHFYAPSLKHYETTGFRNSSEPFFIPVSVTGGACSLRCEHCKGKILKSMHEAGSPQQLLEIARRLQDGGGKGLLISGGSLADGSVPLLDYVEALGQLKEMGLKVAVHTGLVDERLAAGLAGAGVDIAMIDIIGADETIRDVYHLDATVADFERSLRLLGENGVTTAPHVVIGLHFGEIRGEAKALEMISRHPVSSLVLVLLTPQPDTPMQGVAPPTPETAGLIFAQARRQFPETPILLGCARPAGEHKFRTDTLALQAGLNGIAYPAEGIVELAGELGLEPVFSEQCCALITQEESRAQTDNNMAAAGHGDTDGVR